MYGVDFPPPMLTILIVVKSCIYVQIRKFMGLFKEDRSKTHKQPTLCMCIALSSNYFN